ncbi:MAG: hypothetical protein ACR2IM_01255 [Sediminibacterium sp.]
MKIELKNFKFYDKLSEETYCFQATIWVDGVKCGIAENRGIGGETDYYHDCTEASRELIKLAEVYCQSLPPITWNSSINGKVLELEMNLTRYIDEMVEVLVKKKEDDLNAKILIKKMQKAILIGNQDKYQEIGFKMPLKEVWQNHPDYFKQVLKEKLNQYAKNGYRLLNTNIPMQFLN